MLCERLWVSSWFAILTASACDGVFARLCVAIGMVVCLPAAAAAPQAMVTWGRGALTAATRSGAQGICLPNVRRLDLSSAGARAQLSGYEGVSCRVQITLEFTSGSQGRSVPLLTMADSARDLAPRVAAARASTTRTTFRGSVEKQKLQQARPDRCGRRPHPSPRCNAGESHGVQQPSRPEHAAWPPARHTVISFKSGTTRIRTPGFPHAKRTRYHCVTVPACP